MVASIHILYIVLTIHWHYFIPYLIWLHAFRNYSTSLFSRAFTVIWSQVREPTRPLCSRVVFFGLEFMELFTLPKLVAPSCVATLWNMTHQFVVVVFFNSAFNFFHQSFPASSREQQVICQDWKLVSKLWLPQFMKKSFFCLQSFTGSLYLLWSWDLCQNSAVDIQLS